MKMERFTCIDHDKRKGIDIVFFVNNQGKIIHKHVDRLEEEDVKWNDKLGLLQQ
jgi:sensor domain CHASE-containing protein